MNQTADPAQVRRWARAARLPVGDRGRLSFSLVAAYKAADPGQADTTAGPAAPTPAPRRKLTRGELAGAGFSVVAAPARGMASGRTVRAPRS